jgi:hypothetical protein
LEQELLTLASEDGESLVQDVTRTAANAQSALVNPLPDLVVHWRDAAFSPILKIKDSKVAAQVVSKKSTGQHASLGFCIYRGNGHEGLDCVVAAKDLRHLIATSL